MTERIPIKEIETYYEPKTQELLKRYGPGPRVHYHAGIVDKQEPIEVSAQSLKEKIHTSQECILDHIADVCNASSALCGDVIDVGCGLGGGAIFWAQEFGANVTAVTCVPSHIEWISHFATQAGVASKVQPLLCDAVEVPGENCFDSAIALDSSCHMPRKALFARLASLLRPGGRVFITDCFFKDSKYEELFNHHWHAPIGTYEEYRTAAQEAGFQEDMVNDLSKNTERFWALTSMLVKTEATQEDPSPSTAAKSNESFRVHTLVREGLLNGDLGYALLSFSKN